MIARFNKYNPLNDKNYYDEYPDIIIRVRNSDDVEKLEDVFNNYKFRYIKEPLLDYIRGGDEAYLRYNKNIGLGYSSMDYFNNSGSRYTNEKMFTVEDLPFIMNIINNKGEIRSTPNYMLSKEERGKRFIREKNIYSQYGSIIMMIRTMEEFYKFQETINVLDGIINDIDERFEIGTRYNLSKNKKPYIRNKRYEKTFSYGSLEFLDSENVHDYDEKFYMEDLSKFVNLIKNDGEYNDTPRYMLPKEGRNKRFIREEHSKKYSDDFSHVVVEIKNIEELDKVYDFFRREINPLTVSTVEENYYNGTKTYLNHGEIANFIYYFDENYIRYGKKSYTVENPTKFKIEKLYNSNELEQVKKIIKDDVYPIIKPYYMLSKEERDKRFVRENKTYFEKYECVIIEFSSKEEIEKSWEYIHENKIGIDISPRCLTGSIEYMESGEIPVFLYISSGDNWMYGTKKYVIDNPIQNPHLKFYTINDLPEIKKLIKNKDMIIPFYMLSREERRKRFVTENFNEFLLEKSSLTRLGIPREVMQPIQKDLALSPDVEWEKINHKKDILSELKNGGANMFIQIELNNIKVFVSYPTPKGTQYFIDNYVYRDTGWSGEFEKLKREYKTLTQLSYDIEPRSNIYKLNGEFSINKQSRRKFIKKEKSFLEFSDKFKTDFLQKFDKILKRISGTNFKKAKDKVTDKAKKIAIENSLLIKGLDNPLTGPNGLSILDEFLYQFEDAYSEYFEERIDIQELSEYFTKDKLMTMFMYYIYTGKILIN